MPKELKPQVVSDLDLAFGGKVKKFMPNYESIPNEYKTGRNKWTEMVGDWFFCGLKDVKLTPKQGIDERAAIRHIQAILGSFEPTHEHKEAACAYLLSLWFDDATYARAK